MKLDLNVLKFLIPAIGGYLFATSLSFAALNELEWANSYPNEIREDLLTVEYDGEKFIAGGSGGAIWYSETGTSWKRGSITGNEEIIAKTKVANIRYTGGRYFAFGTNSASAGIVQMTSEDGISWMAESQSSAMRDSDIVYAFDTYSRMNHIIGTRSIEFGNGTLVRMSRNYVIWISENAMDWSPVDSTFAPDNHKLRFLDGQFYALIREGKIYRSSDGAVWDLVFEDPSGYLEDIAYFKGKLHVIQTGHPQTHLLHSSDGINWDRDAKFYGAPSMLALAASDHEMVAVGGNGSILRTVDGETWNGVRSDPYSRRFASNGTILVGLNGHKDSWYSENGYTLYQIEFEKERYFNEIAAFKGGFIAYDYVNEELLTSSDGKQWTPTAETPEQLKGNNDWYIVNDRMFVVPYFSRDLPVATTTDGSNWSYFEDFGVNHIYNANGGFHASERNTANVHTSTDGLNWTERDSTLDQLSPFHPNYALFFKNAFYASAGNRIYKSADGLEWTILVEDDVFPYHYRGGLLTIWDDHLVYAGANGSLGVSSDGVQWTHFEVGASTRVEQLLEVGDNIVLDLEWNGLIQSRAPDTEDNQPIDALQFDVISQSLESRLSEPQYPERQYGLLLQSNDLRKWAPAMDADYSVEAGLRRTNVQIDLGEDRAVFFRNGYLTMRDLFGPWVGFEKVEVEACNGVTATSASTQYFAEVRTKENQGISIELLDTEDYSQVAIFEGTFNIYEKFEVRAIQAKDSNLQGQHFEAYIGKENDAPLISLTLTLTNENGCPTYHEIYLTR